MKMAAFRLLAARRSSRHLNRHPLILIDHCREQDKSTVGLRDVVVHDYARFTQGNPGSS